MSGHRFALVLVCEHCGKQFKYELQVPTAVRCTECDSVFDARLALAKGFKEEWKEIVLEAKPDPKAKAENS